MRNQVAIIGPEPWMLEISGAALELPTDAPGPLSARLASASRETAAELKVRGLEVVDPSETAGTRGAIDTAAELIAVAPSLEAIVRRCVKEIVILRSGGECFDVSHSEPRWPTRVFVSVPTCPIVGDLRLAEGVVHEAMHLNLTFLEDRAQLTMGSELMYSPWRIEPRPASGVLHGLYVFACIYRFFEHISRQLLLDDCRKRHIRQRLADITAEVFSIERLQLLQCLTPSGKLLAEDLFAVIRP